jgi:hypothetical protein
MHGNLPINALDARICRLSQTIKGDLLHGLLDGERTGFRIRIPVKNAGVDSIPSYNKMFVFQQVSDRLLVLLTAGNLATTQAVVNRLQPKRSTGSPFPWEHRPAAA